MEIKLKKLKDSRYFPSNEMAIKIQSNILDDELKNLDKLSELVEGNINNGKFAQGLFDLFHVSFADDFSDVLEFLKAEKGTIKTSIPYDNGMYRKTEVNTETWINRWTNLEYEVAYQGEIDLDHVYSYDEIKSLVAERKIVLLSSRPYKNVSYQYGYQQISNDAKKELTTIENYDFDNIYKNGLYNNEVVIPMVRSIYDTNILKEILDVVKGELLSKLNRLVAEAKLLERMYSEKMYECERFSLVCDSKIKKLNR